MIGIRHQNHARPPKLMKGAVSGLMGGVVFGILMAMLNMIGMVAALVGSKSEVVGWALHLGISLFIGVTFAFLFQDELKSISSGLTGGVGDGIPRWQIGTWFERGKRKFGTESVDHPLTLKCRALRKS